MRKYLQRLAIMWSQVYSKGMTALLLCAGILVCMLSGCGAANKDVDDQSSEIKPELNREEDSDANDEAESESGHPITINVLCEENGMAHMLLQGGQSDLEAMGYQVEFVYTSNYLEGTPDVQIDLAVLAPGDIMGSSVIMGMEELIDLQDLIGLDATYSKNDYFSGTVVLGVHDTEQKFLPVAVRTQYIMMGEDQANRTDWGILPDQPTLKMISDTIAAESEAHANDLKYASLMPERNSMYGMSGYALMQQTGALNVDAETGMVWVNDEAMAYTLSMLKTVKEDWNLINETGDFNSRNMFHSLGFVPNEFDEYTSGWISQWAPGYGISMHASMYDATMDQTVHPIWIPSAADEGTYYVELSLVGGILQSADEPEAAYEVLRYLMDGTDVRQWKFTEMLYTSQDFPVNRAVAEALVQELSQNPVESYVESTYTGQEYRGIALSQDLQAAIYRWMDGVGGAYIVDSEMDQIVRDCMLAYYNGETDDVETCITNMIALLEEVIAPAE